MLNWPLYPSATAGGALRLSAPPTYGIEDDIDLIAAAIAAK